MAFVESMTTEALHGTQFVWSLNNMNTEERYRIQESIKDAVVILDSAPIRRDWISERMIVQLTNRMHSAHLAIEKGLKAFITAGGGEYDKGHGLNYLYRELRNCDEDSADFLGEAFRDAVKFFGYKAKDKGFGYFRSLDDYLSKSGTEHVFERLRYWVIELPKEGEEEPFKYISPPIHRELLCALWNLFFSKRRETVSARIEREVAEAMFMERRISYSSDDTSKEESVRRYMDWLFKEHTTRRGALEAAVHQNFVMGDDFANQTVRDAYDALRRSKDPAVQYYIRKLTYLPKGSQPRNPDARPVSTPNRDSYPTAVTVATPAGRDLGIIEKYPDGAWGITPSEEGFVQETEIAEALADAKAYLVNRLTKQVTVTVNGESKQLRMVGGDFLPQIDWTSEPPFTYDIEFWDENHGLLPGEEVSIELQWKANHRPVSVLEGMVTAVEEQRVSIKGTNLLTSKQVSAETVSN